MPREAGDAAGPWRRPLSYLSPFVGEAARARLSLTEIPLWMPARVPSREKGTKGELFLFTAE